MDGAIANITNNDSSSVPAFLPSQFWPRSGFAIRRAQTNPSAVGTTTVGGTHVALAIDAYRPGGTGETGKPTAKTRTTGCDIFHTPALTANISAILVACIQSRVADQTRFAATVRRCSAWLIFAYISDLLPRLAAARTDGCYCYDSEDAPANRHIASLSSMKNE